MAQAASPTTGQKRGAGRPPKTAQPALKKTRLSSTLDSSSASSVRSPTVDSPAPEGRSNKLPHRISEHRPLPTLPEPQAPLLSNEEYQSIAQSSVLETSLNRSRLKWINEGIFERYWVKPESGKNARPPPPNNPELKLQKHKGPCRIRIEPHIFEVEMYVEEKAKPQVVKQYVPPQPAYNQPYRQGQQQPYGQQNQYYQQNRALPLVQQQQPAAHAPAPAQSTPQDKKTTPDPVISMLATRASSDPKLKALMKEVATGNATQEQLKVFQNHIDELTKVIADKKKKEEAEAAAQAQAQQKQQEMIQYDGAADQPPPPQQYYQQPPTYQTYQPPPPPAPQPVILAFTTPGATEDRFLFPQHSILESLSPQHLLASFLVTRRGSQAVDSTGLDPNTEYWQPVTLMVEVAYQREGLIECVKKWVKPAEEVRKYMEEVMARAERAPESWLALRLPVKGSGLEGEPEEVLGEVGVEVKEAMEKERERKTVRYVKKAKKEDVTKTAGKDGDKKGAESDKVAAEGKSQPADAAKDGAPTTASGEVKTDAPEATDTGRPKRAVRKSVRISEG